MIVLTLIVLTLIVEASNAVFKRRPQKPHRPVRRQENRSEPVLKSAREIQIMREAGRVVARVHQAMKETV
ncbi:MAG: hypothetical protein KDD78_05275, partial [Caldilineaceae bacterium]|nr:hypothetical protein [Caldilineaceae bacterium]